MDQYLVDIAMDASEKTGEALSAMDELRHWLVNEEHDDVPADLKEGGLRSNREYRKGTWRDRVARVVDPKSPRARGAERDLRALRRAHIPGAHRGTDS